MLFLGHQKNWELLSNEANQNRLPAAYLFYGAPGIGKKKVALAFVEKLFGRELAENRHPDLFFIEPEGQSIKIEAIRSCQQKIQRAPLEAALKVVVIDEAQEMTRAASNSLLKTLEEPPRDTLFILMARSVSQILPTIRSRCRLMYFKAPPVEESVRRFSTEWEFPSDRLRDLLEIVDGSPGLTRMMASEEMAQALQGWESFVRQRERSFAGASKMAQSWIQQEVDLPLFLEALKKKYFGALVKKNRLDQLSKIDLLSRAQRDLEGNVNKALVLENLMLDLTT